MSREEPLAKDVDRAMTDNELAIDWIRLQREITSMRVRILAMQFHLRRLRWAIAPLMLGAFLIGFYVRGLL